VQNSAVDEDDWETQDRQSSAPDNGYLSTSQAANRAKRHSWGQTASWDSRGRTRRGVAPSQDGSSRQGAWGQQGRWAGQDSRNGPPRGAIIDKPKQLRDQVTGEALYGINPVLGALQALRRDVHVLYVQEGEDSLSLDEVVNRMVLGAPGRV
jgi:hypothetical protein